MVISAALTNIGRVGLVVGGCNSLGFAATALLETHKLTDLVGAGSFVAATLTMSYQNGLHKVPFMRFQSPKLVLVNLGVMLWGTRLAAYLFSRVLQVGEDKRLNKFFRKPGETYFDKSRSFYPIKLASFWTIQAAWGFLCLLPVTLLNAVPTLSHGLPNPQLAIRGTTPFHTAFSALAIAGIFGGLVIEAVADWQKNSYRNDKRNECHWCDRGLWRLSRYPNYFGEMLTWWSIYFASLPALLGAPAAVMIPYAPLVALISPAFITFLLLRVSGIPLLESKYAKQYKDNAEYAEYVRTTPLLVPNVFKVFASNPRMSKKAE